MRIAIASSTYYRACLPWERDCRSYYGSEAYHAILAWALSHEHEVIFFAPAGSSLIGTTYYYNYSQESDVFTLTGLRLEEFDADVFIDMTATAQTVPLLAYYTDIPYLAFRNGYNAYTYPVMGKERNYVVISKTNQKEFAKAGFRSEVCYYGIPDFYSSGRDEDAAILNAYNLEPKSYYLFLNRPHKHKGIYTFLEIVEALPAYKFVMSWGVTSQEHIREAENVLKTATERGLLEKNLKYIPLPLNPQHHRVKRALLRNAKALVIPLHPEYIEGFGLVQAEAIAAGTPLLTWGQESQKELWKEGRDAYFVNEYRVSAFIKALQELNASIDTFKPKCEYTVERSVNSWLELIKKVINGELSLIHI